MDEKRAGRATIYGETEQTGRRRSPQSGSPARRTQQPVNVDRRRINPEQEIRAGQRMINPEQEMRAGQRMRNPEQEMRAGQRMRNPEQAMRTGQREGNPEQSVNGGQRLRNPGPQPVNPPYRPGYRGIQGGDAVQGMGQPMQAGGRMPQSGDGWAEPPRRRDMRPQDIRQQDMRFQEEPRRRRDEDGGSKLRILWTALGILGVLLAAAIVYEIVLGNGIRQTGSERMENQKKTEGAAQPNAGQNENTAQPDAGQNTNTAQPDAGQNANTAQPDAGQNTNDAQPDGVQDANDAQPDAGEPDAADPDAEDPDDEIPTIQIDPVDSIQPEQVPEGGTGEM